MLFRLVYSGPLRANGDLKHKQHIRRALHPQLRELWETELKHESRLDVWKPRSVGSFKFVPLVISAENLIAELDVLLLRQEEPGKILTRGGDIDNRLKTLFDALPMPKDASEIPPGDKPGANEAPFYCLLEE